MHWRCCDMKKRIFLLLVAIFIANVNAREKFSFQFNPLLFFVHNVFCNMDIDFMPDADPKRDRDRPICFLADIEFQYAINEKIALFINPSFAKSNGGISIDGIDGTTYYKNNGLSLITGLLYYPHETGLRGMYLGIFPVIGWGYITKDGKIIKDFLNIGSMAEIGYEWIKENGFTITLGTGVSKIHQIPSSPSVFAPEINEEIEFSENSNSLYGINLGGLPFDVRLRCSIGYSF